MRSLFFRIFGAFWLSHLLTVVLVLMFFPPPKIPRTGRFPRERFEAVRISSIFIGSGALALALTYYLTSPTLKLRRATQRFADGELSTRVVPEIGHRTDELGELARDFDVMAERIQNLLESERRLLGDISHELRSPLARVQLALDLADTTANEETRTYLKRIEQETGRLNQMIGQLLTLTRLEGGAFATANTLVDLTDIVAEVCEDAAFEAQGWGKFVHPEIEPGIQLKGDPQLLRSAVENVVRNALLHTPESSTVEVTLRRENKPSRAIIIVRDHGPGVPEGHLEDLFRPFFRVAEARDRKTGGVGLGLSITDRAVRLHHGSVRAINAPEGGLQVELDLPVMAA